MTNYRLKKLRNLNNEELEVRKYVLNNLYKGKKKTNIAYMTVTAILSVAMIVFMINVFDQSPHLLKSSNHGTAAVEGNNSKEVINKIEELSTVWATALKTRDGEPRYEMMSEKAKEKFIQEQIIASGENWNYVIGDSSPWVVSFEIQIEGMTATITYDMRTNEASNFSKTETIHFIEDEYGELIVDDYKSTEIIDNISNQINVLEVNIQKAEKLEIQKRLLEIKNKIKKEQDNLRKKIDNAG
jgi:hypothetical protein